MRNLPISRDQAEWLVDLLEKDCDPKHEESWQLNMADDLRKLFGMAERPKQSNE